ncbi:MAG: XRE family transcriptional regulator [Gemmatimonadetes bacterium]|nr:XRE family transcriptional regulator [Gemmatimonadota bacterium]
MNDSKVTPSSGNVFADLGLPDAPELLAKADLAIEIARVLDERGFSQAEAARLLHTSQPRISDLRRGKLDGFTFDRLLRFLNALDRDVELVVSPKRSAEARVLVSANAAA